MIRFKRQFPWVTRKAAKPPGPSSRSPEPLREFVYLDEVSLASLLASQKGEITENVTSQSSDETVAELGSVISSNAPLLPSGEINSRFQTTNSSSLQTLRKANAQSLFRELHRFDYLRKIKPVEITHSATSMEDLKSSRFDGAVHRSTQLERGDLVEFKVRLSASWIFQISTMVAEFSDMFDESPSLFMGHVKFTDIYQAQNANNIISKLLAGLIPVDGVVSDYYVVGDGTEELIVHRDAITGLDTETHPLRIVGVTEHLAYWKDIRRVLFAENEFTMLCRLSRSGIQNDWNPIKVADIFKEFAPDLAQQIESTSKAAMVQSAMKQDDERIEPTASQMTIALARYKDSLLSKIEHNVAGERLTELDRVISTIPVEDTSAEGQRAAFAKVKSLIEASAQQQIDTSLDFAIRETVRKNLDLPLFPRPITVSNETPVLEALPDQHQKARLLDVEVVAIYW